MKYRFGHGSICAVREDLLSYKRLLLHVSAGAGRAKYDCRRDERWHCRAGASVDHQELISLKLERTKRAEAEKGHRRIKHS